MLARARVREQFGQSQVEQVDEVGPASQPHRKVLRLDVSQDQPTRVRELDARELDVGKRGSAVADATPRRRARTICSANMRVVFSENLPLQILLRCPRSAPSFSRTSTWLRSSEPCQ